MSENITQEMIDRWNKQLEYCIENQHKLNEWEEEFVDSVSKYLSDNKKLKFKQSCVLRKIYNKL